VDRAVKQPNPAATIQSLTGLGMELRRAVQTDRCDLSVLCAAGRWTPRRQRQATCLSPCSRCCPDYWRRSCSPRYCRILSGTVKRKSADRARHISTTPKGH